MAKNRTERLGITLTAEEKKKIEAAAAKIGMSVATFVRAQAIKEADRDG